MKEQHATGAQGAELQKILEAENAARRLAKIANIDPERFEVYLWAMAIEYEAYGESWYDGDAADALRDYRLFEEAGGYESYEPLYKEALEIAAS